MITGTYRRYLRKLPVIMAEPLRLNWNLVLRGGPVPRSTRSSGR